MGHALGARLKGEGRAVVACVGGGGMGSGGGGGGQDTVVLLEVSTDLQSGDHFALQQLLLNFFLEKKHGAPNGS